MSQNTLLKRMSVTLKPKQRSTLFYCRSLNINKEKNASNTRHGGKEKVKRTQTKALKERKALIAINDATQEMCATQNSNKIAITKRKKCDFKTKQLLLLKLQSK
jgi:hypothetical protein